MKVGDTVKLKPAMWQGIKPESYGLSFTGEYIIDRYVSGDYPNIWLKGFSGIWDVEAFQVVIKEKEKDLGSKFKAGDVVYLSQSAIDQFSPNDWGKYHLPLALYNGAKGVVELVEKLGHEESARVHVNIVGYGHCFFMEEDLELTPIKEVLRDAVHSPKHYAVFADVEAIEIIARSMTKEMFKGYCFGNLLKYRLRAGNKDDVKQELGKADKYKELYEKYKDLCQ